MFIHMDVHENSLYYWARTKWGHYHETRRTLINEVKKNKYKRSWVAMDIVNHT